MRPLAVLVTLALSTVFLFPAAPLVETAEAGSAGIQPGDLVTTSVGQCTLNFVFDGVGPLAGRVYLGTAAHCVSSIGQSASTTSYSGFGTVAFMGDANSEARDYAFIQVRADLVDRVDPAVRGHSASPTGSTTSAETGLGQLVRFSGYGLGFGTTSVTREERVGAIVSDTPQVYVIEAPIIFGDSGGPILHQSGKAYGVVSQVVIGCCSGPGVWMTGPTVQNVVSDAAAHGFPVALRPV